MTIELHWIIFLTLLCDRLKLELLAICWVWLWQFVILQFACDRSTRLTAVATLWLSNSDGDITLILECTIYLSKGGAEAIADLVLSTFSLAKLRFLAPESCQQHFGFGILNEFSFTILPRRILSGILYSRIRRVKVKDKVITLLRRLE